MKKSITLSFVIIVSLIIFSTKLHSQDSHYWTNEYGTRAQLLGGAVAGSIIDLSSTFYNPGAIALTDFQTLIISTEAFQFTEVEYKNGAGTGIDIESTDPSRSPSIVAIRIPPSLLNGNNLVLSVLKKNEVEFELDGRNIDPYQGLPENYFAGELIFLQDIRETWIGLSWSNKISDNIGLGVTQYVAVRKQRQRFQNISELVTNENEGSAAINYNDFYFNNYRLLWKLGLTVDEKPFTFGVALTTPSLNLFGSGWTSFNSSLIEVDTSGSGNSTSFLSSNYQDALDPVYKNPFSIGGGLSYKLNSTTFHLSAEWFAPLDVYEVLNPSSFSGQSTGDTILNKYELENNAVLNFGIGVQYTINRYLAIYGGVRTDFSTKASYNKNQISINGYDIIHLTLGSSFSMGSFDFILGGSYSFGNEKSAQLADFGSRDILNINNFGKSDVKYQRIKFIVGFSFNL